MASIRILDCGAGKRPDLVYVLKAAAGRGRINEAGVRLKGMTGLAIKGVDRQGNAVDLIRTMPSYKEAVRAIGDRERNTWGQAMFDAFIAPIQNRQKANKVVGPGSGSLEDASGQSRTIPVDKEGVMLHAFCSLLPWQIVSVDESRDLASITALAAVPPTRWFGSLVLLQTISLEGGVLTRSTLPLNVGPDFSYYSATNHAYFKIPEGQRRAEVQMLIPAQSYLNTITPPFAEKENLLPDLTKDPYLDVSGSSFAKLFQGPSSSRMLGNNFLDHCFTRLLQEGPVEDGGYQVAARAFFPAVGWGVKVSAFMNGISALQVYAPPASSNPAAANAFCFEFAQCLTNPFDPAWKSYPVTQKPDRTPSGMWILPPLDKNIKPDIRTIQMIGEMPERA
jgi:galactose mutarotase-like enzyme